MLSIGYKYRIIISSIIIASLICILILIFCQKPERNIIKIGYQPYASSHSSIMQAMQHLKLLEEKGYKPEYIPFLSGPPINEALASGSLDIGFDGDMPAISALASGMRVKIVAASVKSLRQAIIVDRKKAEEIKSVKDLVGKKVAVTKGSTSHYFLYKVLMESGIEPKTIDIISLNVKDQVEALVSDHIDACVAWEPWPTKLEKEGIGKIIEKGEASQYALVREDFIDKSPRAVQAFVDAMQEALEYSQKNFDQTSQWVAEETKDDFDIIRNAARTDRIFELGEDIKPEPELMEGLKRKAEFLFGQGLITNIPDFSQKTDFSFIDKTLGAKK